MAQHPAAAAGWQGRLRAARQEERGQRLELRGRKTNKALVAMGLILVAMGAMGGPGFTVAAVAAVEQIKVVVVVVAVVQILRQQALLAQEELERKVPQAPQAKHLAAQQTFQPTQAGRCPS